MLSNTNNWIHLFLIKAILSVNHYFSIPVYDDYKFVGRSELERLGLSHLIGSNLLRAYMHGYFMDVRLYNKVSQQAYFIYGPIIWIFRKFSIL